MHPAKQFRRGGTAAQPHIGLPFRIDTHAGDQQAAIGLDIEVEQPARGGNILHRAPAEHAGVLLGHLQHRHIGHGGAPHPIIGARQGERPRNDAAIFVGRQPDIAAASGGKIIAAQDGGVGHHHADIHRKGALIAQIDAARSADAALAGFPGKAGEFQFRRGEAGIQADIGGHRTQQGRFHPATGAADPACHLRIAQRA